MSALAQVLLAQGYVVSGSDRFLDVAANLELLTKLRKAGVELLKQDGSGVNPETAAVIVSTAIESDNPDILEARRKNVPVLHRAEMLALLSVGRRLVAITGTSGKTTVTGMIGWILECADANPTVVNGGASVEWRTDYRIGNVRIGRSNLWVVEADESDRSLLRFDPEWAVVTNISKDHFELAEVTRVFQQFAARVKTGIVCGPGVAEALRNPPPDILKTRATLVDATCEPREESGGWRFQYKNVSFLCPLIGRHNAENAFAAVVLCDRLGISLEVIRKALESFKGIERRLERVGEAGGIAVVDDYAHNPAKIRAGWQSLAPKYERVIGVWRPHGFAPLKSMLPELIDAFASVCRPTDQLLVLPVYYAGGTAERTVSSGELVDALKSRGIAAELVEDYGDLLALIKTEARAGDVILCMGARDPDLPAFARKALNEFRSG